MSKRIIAVLLVLLIAFSVFYTALEGEHCCSGERCAICAMIAVCVNLLEGFAVLLAGAFCLSLVSVVVLLSNGCVLRACAVVTPVLLRVKLSD